MLNGTMHNIVVTSWVGAHPDVLACLLQTLRVLSGLSRRTNYLNAHVRWTRVREVTALSGAPHIQLWS